MSDPLTTRRTLLAAAGAAGLTATLTACGDSGDSDSDGGSNGGSGGADTDTGSQAPEGEDAPEGGEDGGGAELTQTSEIPEGGGAVFKDEKVVVTQPTEGEFRAYSAECTHQGCLVREVSEGTINCVCHGSKFDITDGSVTDGPAKKPLPAAKISVDGNTIRLA